MYFILFNSMLFQVMVHLCIAQMKVRRNLQYGKTLQVFWTYEPPLSHDLTPTIKECVEIVENATDGIEEVKRKHPSWHDRLKSSDARWNSKRKNILMSMVADESSAGKICRICGSSHVVYRCIDCCSSVLCDLCDSNVHLEQPLHDRDVLFGGFWKPVAPDTYLHSDGSLERRGNLQFVVFYKNCLLTKTQVYED